MSTLRSWSTEVCMLRIITNNKFSLLRIESRYPVTRRHSVELCCAKWDGDLQLWQSYKVWPKCRYLWRSICHQSLFATRHSTILQVKWVRRSDVSRCSFIWPLLSPFSSSGSEPFPFTTGLKSTVTINCWSDRWRIVDLLRSDGCG